MVIPSSALDRFRGPHGVCSAEVATAAGVVLLPSALACTVAQTGRKLTVSSTRGQFGHLVPASVAKLQPDNRKSSYPYFSAADANQGLDQRADLMRQWNPELPTKAGHLERVEAFHSAPKLGYLLVVGRHWNATLLKYGDPILRVVAAPSMMRSDAPVFTYNAQS
jgi:hypothetical protein